MNDKDVEQRRRLLRMLEVIMGELCRLFIAHNILIPEMEKTLRWRAVSAVLNDDAFAVEGREQAERATLSRAALLTGLTRAEVAQLAQLESAPIPADGGDLHRLIRILTAWRVETGYQDEEGHPIDLPVRGRTPSLHQLCRKYGRDMPTRAIADELVKNGNAKWIGESEGTRQGKMLRLIHPVVTGEYASPEEMVILLQVIGDFLHSFRRMFVPNEKLRPRFREGYFNDIDLERAEEAMTKLRAESQAFNVRCTALLQEYRAPEGKPTIRLGAGSYLFSGAPLFLQDGASLPKKWRD